MLFFLFLLLFLPYLARIDALQKDDLLASNECGQLKFLNLRKFEHQYLQEAKIASSMVEDEFECAFLCVGEQRCSSINVAASPDSKGLYLCELLTTEKYQSADKLRVNTSFHHFSPWVSCFKSNYLA